MRRPRPGLRRPWGFTTALPGVSSPVQTLEDEGYVQRGVGAYRRQHTFSPTPRLLALAGQLAARLPLVTHGERIVRRLHESTGLDAYLVIPSYGDVIVLAGDGEHPVA